MVCMEKIRRWVRGFFMAFSSGIVSATRNAVPSLGSHTALQAQVSPALSEAHSLNLPFQGIPSAPGEHSTNDGGFKVTRSGRRSSLASKLKFQRV